MKIKQRLEDFRVRELLRPDYVVASGEWRVYRVTKKKLTSLDAAAVLAREAGVPAGDVTMAGFKDRQGVTVQHMALHRGREVLVAERDLKIESIGFAASELSSRDSDGNAFEIVVRGLDGNDLTTLRANLTAVREHGVLNYFDEQRFGNLRHGQGWIALELLHGRQEQALRQLVASPSVADDPQSKAFKTALNHAWGDWAECRDVAGRFGQYHSVFEHLKKNPGDFAGAFFHVASRVRLIHLYAYQSHLWNRAVANLVRARAGRAERVVVESEEGPLVYPLERAKLADLGERFRLPGPRLEDVTNADQRRALEEVLSRDKVAAEDFDIRGVSGFQLKGEDRELWVTPAHLRVRPAEPDQENPPFSSVKLRFELPRGAYATLVVRRLLARALDEREEHAEGRDAPAGRDDERAPRFGARPERGPRDARDRDDARRERSFGRGEPRDRAWRPSDRRGPRDDFRGASTSGERPPRYERGGSGERRGGGEGRSYGPRGGGGGGRGGSWRPRDGDASRDFARGPRDAHGAGERRGFGFPSSPARDDGSRGGGAGGGGSRGGDSRGGGSRGYGPRGSDRDDDRGPRRGPGPDRPYGRGRADHGDRPARGGFRGKRFGGGRRDSSR
ncbi:MAG: tRNA pseudouridine(13) synthase TruD [Planctomycetes bacterium]|nr:tRNA pseudouridine(13) synthase TruD [Planctomycetota bacterium]